jgi:hypothetical protein
MAEGITAEDLYLDRLPWEDVREYSPQPEAGPKLVQSHTVTFILSELNSYEAGPDATYDMLNSVWTEHKWPFLLMDLSSPWYPTARQFTYWLPWWDHDFSIAGTGTLTLAVGNNAMLEVAGRLEELEDTSRPTVTTRDSETPIYDQAPSDSVLEPVTARKAKPTSINYKARLSLIPRFIKEVFTHPFSDFTLLRRGDEVLVVEKGGHFSGKDLSGVDLHGANLQDAVLRGTNLSDAVLTNANLRGANLEGAVLDRADLSYADLRGANVDPKALSQAVTEGTLLDSRSHG